MAASKDLWYGSVGPRDAAIAIVGESWGKDEEMKGQPFVGLSGEFLTKMLADAGIVRRECFITNVCPRHPQDNKIERFFFTTKEAKAVHAPLFRGCYPHAETIEDIKRLWAQLGAVRPKVIIAFGNWALWALSSVQKVKNTSVTVQRGSFHFPLGSFKTPTGITFWRGSQLFWEGTPHATGCIVIPVIHPAAIVRQSHLRACSVHDLRARAEPVSRGIIESAEYDFTLRPTFEQAVSWLGSALRTSTRFSIDVETRYGHLACVCVATSSRRAISIPLMCVERPEGYFPPSQEMVIRALLREILTNPRHKIIGQNFTYDMQYFWRWLWFHPKLDHDTMVIQRTLWPGTPLSLWYMSSLYCRYYRYWKDEGKTWDEGLDEDILWRYNCVDGVTTFESAEVQERLIGQLGFTAQAAEQMEIARLGYEIMNTGMLVDRREQARMTFENLFDMQSVEEYLWAIIPKQFIPLLQGKGASKSPWYDSPAQQGRFFYDVLGLKEHRNKDTGARTCDDAALMKIKRDEPIVAPICDKIQELRTMGIWNNNFLTKRLDYDGRMRTMLSALPSTLRWSSKENAFGSGTNMQTIPKGDTD